MSVLGSRARSLRPQGGNIGQQSGWERGRVYRDMKIEECMSLIMFPVFTGPNAPIIAVSYSALGKCYSHSFSSLILSHHFSESPPTVQTLLRGRMTQMPSARTPYFSVLLPIAQTLSTGRTIQTSFARSFRHVPEPARCSCSQRLFWLESPRALSRRRKILSFFEDSSGAVARASRSSQRESRRPVRLSES
jgi:hypothetical protein